MEPAISHDISNGKARDDPVVSVVIPTRDGSNAVIVDQQLLGYQRNCKNWTILLFLPFVGGKEVTEVSLSGYIFSRS